MNESEQRRAARKRFQAQYRALYDEVLEILFQIDPLGIHQQDNNTDKLVPETASILARRREARSAEDVEQIVLEELRRTEATLATMRDELGLEGETLPSPSRPERSSTSCPAWHYAPGKRAGGASH